jgi:tripartite-type tricarboxylate transporter receptor subunit TctC
MPIKNLFTASVAVAALIAPLSQALAQAWPEKTITIVVPTAPGGANDAIARIIGQGLSAKLGQAVVVENKAGAGGAIASEYVAKAAPDGYTIMLGYIATHGINPALQKLKYDPVTDFEPIGMIAASPTVLVVNNNVPAKNAKELVQLIKSKPNTFNYASAGNGTAPHIAGELFRMSAALEMQGVPYKGSAPAVVDTIAGSTQLMFPIMFTAYPQVKGGKLRTLGIAGETGAMETQAGLMRELGLGQPLISWHTVRDNFAEVGAFLGIVGGSLGKIAMDVKLLMQTEVAEVFEPYAPGRGSSSTMPQKRNPISCLYIHANISVVRQLAASLMDAMVADHERSTGPWEIEWVAMPEIFCLMSGALKQTKFILAGLEVDAAQMRSNIDMTHGLVMSEAVMMGMGPYIGREYAHDLVYDICREALKQKRHLIELLAEHPEINKHVTREQLEGFCDPMNNLGQAGLMVDRVLNSLKG